MTSRELVLKACAFERPERIPRIENFWKLNDEWREALGNPDDISDIAIRVPDETFFPSGVRSLKEEDGYTYSVDGWGRTIRRREDAYFSEILDVAMPADVSPDSITFEPADADGRFMRRGMSPEEMIAALEEEKQKFCIFGKTGGPFLRSCFLRGEEQFLMDIAGDPPLARAIADKVCDYLTAVGVAEIRRWNLQDPGIWIYDDMGQNYGPMFRAESFEEIFLPGYRRMIRAYKEAGAKYVFLHSDGNIRIILDMLVDAGIEGLNPLEARADMDILEIHEKYPRLILTGGMDNTDTLLNGPIEKIVAEAKAIIDIGREGGIVIGTHSISPEIPLEHYLAYHETCLTYGNFP